MKKILRLVLSFLIVISFIQLSTPVVEAQVCYASRTIYQYYCSGGTGDLCLDSGMECAGPAPVGGTTCAGAGEDQSGNTPYGYCNCITVCNIYNTAPVGGSCIVTDPIYGACNQTTCSVNAEIRNCGWVGGVCNTETTIQPLGCWGPGAPAAVCGNSICETGETCASCSSDCSCSAPFCGDNLCNGAETCSSCAGDCGACNSCGDGVCSGAETCSTCSSDCGSCGGAYCGDGTCNNGETSCTCNGDCPGTCIGCAVCGSPLCGQATCTGFCPNTDSGVPGNPSLTPPSGEIQIPISRQITLSWSNAPLATKYSVQVYPTGTPVGQECTAANTFCQAVNTTRNFTFTAPGNVAFYTWRVRGVNDACSPNQTSAWTTGTFTLVGPITGGTFYDSSNTAVLNLATGICERAGGNIPQNGNGPGTGISTDDWAGNTQTGVVSGTTFTINGVKNSQNVEVYYTPDLAQWRCTCPAGCVYSGISVPQSGINIFLGNVRAPWWQTQNGLIHAGAISGTAVRSAIPSECNSPSCIAALSLRNTISTINSSGLTTTGGGDIDSTADGGSQYTYLSQDGRTSRVVGMRLRGPKEDYGYFYNLFSMGTNPSTDFTGAKPTSAPVNSRAYYRSGNATIGSNWTLAAGEKMVIFVSGNLNVNAQITVPNGAFLAFIVSGNITFSNTIGDPSAAASNPTVAGVFIANNQIIIEGGLGGGDRKFIGEGTFVGWNGVLLNREFSSAALNDSYPTELFRFRPDFITNVPERMTKPLYTWQETN